MHWLQGTWYRLSLLHILLVPLALVFGIFAAVRRALYRAGVLRAVRLPVPVVIVGNISVGGTGKTPLVIWLAGALRERGLQPGVICRGYLGTARDPQRACADSDPKIVGDEAVLLARRCDCPVWIGADRAAAARGLLSAHPECNVVISDDGLQHYALGRDVELAVIDRERGFGNGMLLPAGPLREPPRRLARVDAIVLNGALMFPRARLPDSVPSFEMHLAGDVFYDVHDPATRCGPESLAGQQLHALAAIGHPHRFFDHLRGLGLTFIAHSFADHHAFTASDLAFAGGDAVIMTEKDAVKCTGLRNAKLWALRVDAVVEPALVTLILKTIRREGGLRGP